MPFSTSRSSERGRPAVPELARRLDTIREALAFTDQPVGFDTPDAGALLAIADAVRHRQSVSVRYTGREGRRSERMLHAYGIVAHAGRWYVTGNDAQIGEDRAFRLDRVAGARTLPGSFDRPFVNERPDVLRDLATAFVDRLASYARQA